MGQAVCGPVTSAAREKLAKRTLGEAKLSEYCPDLPGVVLETTGYASMVRGTLQ